MIHLVHEIDQISYNKFLEFIFLIPKDISTIL